MERKRLVALLLCAAMVLSLSGCKRRNYNAAVSLIQFEEWTSAREIFVELGDYRNSAERVKQCDYHFAEVALEEKRYDDAVAMFEALGDYEDAKDRIPDCRYVEAKDALLDEEFLEAEEKFLALGDYRDSADMAKESRYRHAQRYYALGMFEKAIDNFRMISGYRDSDRFIFLSKLRFDPQGYVADLADDMNARLSAESASFRLTLVPPNGEETERTYLAGDVPDELQVRMTFNHVNDKGRVFATGKINRVSITAESFTAEQRERAENDFLLLSSVLMAAMTNAESVGGCRAQLLQQLEDPGDGTASSREITFLYENNDCTLSVSDPGGDSFRCTFTLTVPELVK